MICINDGGGTGFVGFGSEGEIPGGIAARSSSANLGPSWLNVQKPKETKNATARQESAECALLPVSVSGEPTRLAPPAFLSAEEAAFFTELVSACDPSHFRKSDEPLLVAFTQATLMSRETAHDLAKIMAWEKATRMQATLATRLRLRLFESVEYPHRFDPRSR